MVGKAVFTPLQAEAFPKHCSVCGKCYQDEKQFLAETTSVLHAPSDIRTIAHEDGAQDVYLEVFRNCVCGSTLMEYFHSRRDLSEDGLSRRQLFDSMLSILEETGQERSKARALLLQQLPAFKK
jgi:hypothetical protein